MSSRGVLSCCAGWGGAVRSWTWLDCCAARARNFAAPLRDLGLTHGIGPRRTALLCRAEHWRRGPHTLVDLIARLSRGQRHRGIAAKPRPLYKCHPRKQYCPDEHRVASRKHRTRRDQVMTDMDLLMRTQTHVIRLWF